MVTYEQLQDLHEQITKGLPVFSTRADIGVADKWSLVFPPYDRLMVVVNATEVKSFVEIHSWTKMSALHGENPDLTRVQIADAVKSRVWAQTYATTGSGLQRSR